MKGRYVYIRSNIFLLKKIIILVLIISLNISIWLIYQRGHHGYELSLYSTLPSTFWVIILSWPIIIAINASQKSNSPQRAILIGIYSFLLYFSVHIVIEMLPLIKNYTFYGAGDVINHAGHTKYILSNYHFESQLIYPGTHLIITQLVYLTKINVLKLVSYFHVIPGILFPLFLYLYSNTSKMTKHGFYKQSYAIYLYLIVFVYILRNNIYSITVPFGTVIMVSPLLLHSMQKSLQNIKWMAITSIFSISTIILHPLFTFYFIIIVVIFIMASVKINYSQKIPRRHLIERTLYMFIITVISFTLWVIQKKVFNTSLSKFIELLSGAKLENAPVEKLNYVANKLDKVKLIEVILKVYGIDSVLILFSVISGLFMISSYFYATKKTNNTYSVIKSHTGISIIINNILNMFVFGIFFLMLFLKGNPNLMPERLINVIVIISIQTILLGICFSADTISYNTNTNERIKKYANYFKVVFILILLFSYPLSVLTVYPSPYILQPNQQVTTGHLSGAFWFFTNRISGRDVYKLEAANPWRYYAIFHRYSSDQINYERVFWKSLSTDYATIKRGSYIYLQNTEILAYLRLWKVRYNNETIKKLFISNCIIYTNGDDVRILYAP